MSYFKAKMHQIRFRLGLGPRPRWGSSQRSPDSLAGFGVLLLREGKGEGVEKEERGKEGKGEERGGGRKGRGKVASWLLGGGDGRPWCFAVILVLLALS